LTARRNGQVLARGNWKAIHYSFEEMISYASRDAWLLPGDLIGSGTVGGGSILEIGADAAGGWLVVGDVLELAGGPLGTLRNRIVTRDAGDARAECRQGN
jgi:fumarylacetoacetate (FAA) hydrolase